MELIKKYINNNSINFEDMNNKISVMKKSIRRPETQMTFDSGVADISIFIGDQLIGTVQSISSEVRRR